MTDKKALKLALDDLMVEYDMERTSFAKRVDEIFKQALAARQEHEPENEPFVSLASVQEPVAWVDLLKQAEEVVRSKSLWKKYIDGTPLANDIAVWMASFAQEHATPPAAQPAVPDALTSADIQEHIEYVAGWNECRQAMLEMMK
jgi:hypothetical protein